MQFNLISHGKLLVSLAQVATVTRLNRPVVRNPNDIQDGEKTRNRSLFLRTACTVLFARNFAKNADRFSNFFRRETWPVNF